MLPTPARPMSRATPARASRAGGYPDRNPNPNPTQPNPKPIPNPNPNPSPNQVGEGGVDAMRLADEQKLPRQPDEAACEVAEPAPPTPDFGAFFPDAEHPGAESDEFGGD